MLYLQNFWYLYFKIVKWKVNDRDIPFMFENTSKDTR